MKNKIKYVIILFFIVLIFSIAIFYTINFLNKSNTITTAETIISGSQTEYLTNESQDIISEEDANYSIINEIDNSTTYYSNLLDAYENAKDGDTINLLRNVEDKSAPTISKNITINLNSYTLDRAHLDVSESEDGRSQTNFSFPIIINDGGTLIINGEGSFISVSALQVQEGGHLVVNGGNLIAMGASAGQFDSEGGKSFIVSPEHIIECKSSNVEKNAIVTIKGGTIYGIKNEGTNSIIDILKGKVTSEVVSRTLKNKNGTINIGNIEEPVNINTPEVTGLIENEDGTINFFNGVIKQPINQVVELTAIREDTQLITEKELIKDNEYTVIKYKIKETKEYEYKDNSIKNIQPNTDLKTFKNKINSNEDFIIKDGENTVNETDIIKTGEKLYLGDKEYTLVVAGDTTGDGKINISDILKMNKHRIRNTDLEGAYFEAGDIDGNEKVDILDILKVNKFRLGITTEL